MKICFIGPANSEHLVKWCKWFSSRGHELHVISFTPGELPGATVHLIDIGVDANGSDAGKLKYMTTGGKIRRLVHEISPDIVNVHYATSYGIATALSGIQGYILSVWGSDIYEFPKKSPLHRALLKISLRRPALLFSTSETMADEAAAYTKRRFVITPFGVDMKMFRPNSDKHNPHDSGADNSSSPVFTIGTVKTLATLYGIDYLLRATAIIHDERPDINLRIRIAGDGPQEAEYRDLTAALGIDDIVTFLGRIPQEQAATEWDNMDVAIIPSIHHESFGVAAVEAQSCETPLVISDVGGLMETTIPVPYDEMTALNNDATDSLKHTTDDYDSVGDDIPYTSVLVPKQNERAIADAVIRLYDMPSLKIKLGKNGRKNVEEKYELNKCFLHIEKHMKRVQKHNSMMH